MRDHFLGVSCRGPGSEEVADYAICVANVDGVVVSGSGLRKGTRRAKFRLNIVISIVAGMARVNSQKKRWHVRW